MAQQLVGIGTIADDGTGNTARTSFDRINQNFTELYGNVSTLPATSTRAQIQTALTALGAAGGGVLQIGPGTVTLDGTAITPVNKTTIRGCGMGVTIFQQTVLAVRAFSLSGGYGTYDYIAFEDFTVNGMWLANQAQGSFNDRHFSVDGVKRIRYTNIESLYCREMAITSGFCNEVIVTGCRVQYCARDSMNFTQSRRCIVIGNHILNGYDDAIAIHQGATGSNPPTEGHVVANNTIEDSNGIKLLGANKVTISGNTVRRVKAYGVSFEPGGTEGYPDMLAVNIFGNVITDVINGSKFGQGSLATGMFIKSRSTSFGLPVVGAGTPTINKPDALTYVSNAIAAQNAGGYGINIFGNTIFGFTMPAALYSTWGFGLPYTATGIADINLSTGFQFDATGITLSGALLSVNIHDNHIEACKNGVAVASTIVALDQISVKNNNFRRFSELGVSLESGGALNGRAFVDNNIFDGDPYFESANRTAGPDGTWDTAQFKPCAIDTANFKGLVGRGNSFRNVNNVLHTNGSSSQTIISSTYYMQPDSTATLATVAVAANKGIYSAGGIGHDSDHLIWENSDPTSATYGQEIGRSSFRASAMPTTGNYIAGQFVRNTGFAVATQTLEAGATDPTPQYVIIGWKRMTTSSAHVLNTDWRELRALTGN